MMPRQHGAPPPRSTHPPHPELQRTQASGPPARAPPALTGGGRGAGGRWPGPGVVAAGGDGAAAVRPGAASPGAGWSGAGRSPGAHAALPAAVPAGLPGREGTMSDTCTPPPPLTSLPSHGPGEHPGVWVPSPALLSPSRGENAGSPLNDTPNQKGNPGIWASQSLLLPHSQGKQLGVWVPIPVLCSPPKTHTALLGPGREPRSPAKKWRKNPGVPAAGPGPRLCHQALLSSKTGPKIQVSGLPVPHPPTSRDPLPLGPPRRGLQVPWGESPHPQSGRILD